MRLDIDEKALESVAAIEESYGKLAIVVNDIYSFDKELRLWNKKPTEGARIVNMVSQMAFDTSCSYEAAKRILWVLCREWELQHQEMVLARLNAEAGCSDDLKEYMKALEYILGGNEIWSKMSERYHERL